MPVSGIASRARSLVQPYTAAHDDAIHQRQHRFEIVVDGLVQGVLPFKERLIGGVTRLVAVV